MLRLLDLATFMPFKARFLYLQILCVYLFFVFELYYFCIQFETLDVRGEREKRLEKYKKFNYKK